MKTLQDLTIKDNFMFSAVMSQEENCRGLLKLVTDIPVGRVEISRERSFAYHPEYRGVRLDVYAKDENNTRYNVEMQVVPRDALTRRARYYRSQMDMDLLLTGHAYEELPDTYVIFICDFDPFGAGYFRYTFENRCLENMNRRLEDGCRCIFLNTCGKNRDGVSEALVKFLRYVRADLAESQQDFQDDFVIQLQKSVQKIKQSRAMEERFMTLEELLRDERKAGEETGLEKGKSEGMAKSILLLLEDRGTVPEPLLQKILAEKDTEILGRWLRLAAAAKSVSQFEQSI